jgi:hypothetical protein
MGDLLRDHHLRVQRLRKAYAIPFKLRLTIVVKNLDIPTLEYILVMRWWFSLKEAYNSPQTM